MPSHDVTLLLRAWSQGDEVALHRLAPLVYDELCRIASRFLRCERPSATLQTMVLVHEAYIKLVEQDHPEWNGRAHFTAVAAKYMRQILVEHARRRDAGKRGHGERPITLGSGRLRAAAFRGAARPRRSDAGTRAGVRREMPDRGDVFLWGYDVRRDCGGAQS